MRILLYVKNTLWQANEIVPEKENVLKDVAGNNGEWGGGGGRTTQKTKSFKTIPGERSAFISDMLKSLYLWLSFPLQKQF